LVFVVAKQSRKSDYATIVFIIFGLVIGGLLVETQASALAVCFFAWIIIGSWVLSQIRCPNRDTSVAYHGKLGGAINICRFYKEQMSELRS
jgi:hypothetical protein